VKRKNINREWLMAQSNQNKSQRNEFDSLSNEAVVSLKKYQSAEQGSSSINSEFEQMMSQMNISGRAAFDLQYLKYWQQASENSELLSVLICEIDYFKEYTKNYRHQGASFMLLVIGLALKTTCEKYNCYLAHYSDGEFAVLLKGVDTELVQEIAEALRLAVEQSQSEHKFSKVSEVVTLSIGMSSLYPTSMKVLMQKSDNALNSAKKSGHNRVCVTKNDLTGLESVIGDIQESEEIVAVDYDALMSENRLLDRSDFNHYFDHVWEKSVLENDLLAMIICEIDFFAQYKREYKQIAADELLVDIGSTLKSICEEFNCFVSSLEGAKFAILIKGGNATLGLKVANKIELAAQELNIETSCSLVKYCVSVSQGLANIFPSEGNSKKVLLGSAGSALNNAKSAGYNQIFVS